MNTRRKLENDVCVSTLFLHQAGVDYNSMSEEEQIALAIQMSMNDSAPAEAHTKEEGKETAMETEVSYYDTVNLQCVPYEIIKSK